MGLDIFFSVKTQFENLGDALINRELILEAKKKGRVYVDVSRCPSEFVATLNIEGVEFVDGYLKLYFLVLKKRLGKSKVLYFLNPGGLGGRRSFRNRVSYLLYTLLLFALKSCGVRVCHVGISYSKMNTVDRVLSVFRSRVCFKVFPRDTISYRYMVDSGFKVDGIYPDLAFLGNTNVIPGSRKKILLSFRFDGEYKHNFDMVRNFVSEVMESQHDLEFLFYSQVDRDREGMVKLYDYFSGNELVSYMHCSNDLNLAMKVYGDSLYVLSNRLHVLLMGGVSGSTPIACLFEGQSSKIFGLFGDSDITNNIYKITDPWPGFDEFEKITPVVSIMRSKVNQIFDELI